MYDPDGLVDDYVVAYVAELARHADVFVLADGSLAARPARPAVGRAGAWVRAHGAHDFGSWSLLARELVGWDALAAYDEVLLANDSCWLLRPLDEVFARDGRADRATSGGCSSPPGGSSRSRPSRSRCRSRR